MTTNLRDQLVDAFRATLETRVRTRSEIPVAMPLGDLADAAITVLSDGQGVPTLPRYDDELFRARRWTERLTTEQMTEGGGTSARVFTDPERYGGEGAVVLQSLADGDEVLAETALPTVDAQEYGLSVLAAVEAARRPATL